MTTLRFLVASVMCAACSGPSTSSTADIHSAEVAVGTASSIGFAMNLGLNSMTAPPSCATVKTQCASYPCSDGEVSIAVGTGCQLPLGTQTSGTIDVTGMWNSATDATLGASFTGITGSIVVSTQSVTATPTSVSFLGQNASLSGGSALAAQSSWSVTIDGKGTADPSDDVYVVSGTQQAAGGVSSSQIELTDVTITPDCHLNPTSGSGFIQSVNLTSVVQETVTFHSACDGMADVGGESVAVSF